MKIGDYGKMLLGGTGAALTDVTLFWTAPNLATQPLHPLPTIIELGVLAGSFAAFLGGHAMKNDDMKKVGEGALLYSVPRTIHRTIGNAVTAAHTGYAQPKIQARIIQPTPQRIRRITAPQATPPAARIMGTYRVT